jgi:hypothetical protein
LPPPAPPAPPTPRARRGPRRTRAPPAICGVVRGGGARRPQAAPPCVWFFRAQAFSGARAFPFKFLAPLLGMGVILLGVVLMLVMYKLRPEFFKGQVLARGI